MLNSGRHAVTPEQQTAIDAFLARWGRPTITGQTADGRTFIYGWGGRRAPAEAAAAANRDLFGYDSHAEHNTGPGWVCVLNLDPQEDPT